MHSENFSLVFPFQKINKEQRLVTGIATADNPDLVDDIVNFDASVVAFSNWVGNIREMHSPIAVGKLVDWKAVPVMYNGRMYQGIEVSVYISKGAEDTWQKIIDGTLRGFSIGGSVSATDKRFMEEHGRMINEITEYMLGELSVVDNPCNPAGMFAMIKSVDGKLEYVSKDVEDVFYCEVDKYANVGDNSVCPVCSEEMFVIGKTEEFDNSVINKFILSFEQEMTKALSDIDTVPTDAMANEASRGLEWRREFNRGGTPVGVARARDIMNKDKLSISTVRRMHSFFSRHEVDKQGQGYSPGEEGYPSAGRIAWALWGGDPGQSWARAITNRIKSMEKGVGTDVEGMDVEGLPKMNTEINKAEAKKGDFVAWNSSGGTARGKVIRFEDNGMVDVPDSSFSIVGTSEDPALLIQIWEEAANGWQPTETYVGHKSSTVRIIGSLDKSIDTGQIGEDGGGIKNPEQGIDTEKRIVQRDGEFCVLAQDSPRSFGCYSTLVEAQNRLAEIESMDEEDDNENIDMSMNKAATKREDGEDFPASAFAYVPDPEAPSTWKLRLWDSLELKETAAQIGRAVAALGPGGFRGNRVSIPAEDLAGVKAKVRAAWRRVNGPDRELPDAIKSMDNDRDEENIMKGGENVMDLQSSENNDTVKSMSEETFTETQRQTVLSKLGDFIFGRNDEQAIDVEEVSEVTSEIQKDLPTQDGGETELTEELKDLNKAEDAEAEIAEDVPSEEVEKSVEEGETEMDFEKVLEGLSALLDEKLEKVKADIAAEVDGKIESLEKSVSDVKESTEELSTDLEKVANSGAEKKSADVEADDVTEEEALAKSVDSESFWGGIFVPSEIVKVLGYES